LEEILKLIGFLALEKEEINGKDVKSKNYVRKYDINELL